MDLARAGRVARALEGWDHRMTPDSPGAAAFAATWRHLLAGMFAELPTDHRPAGGDRWFAVVQRLRQRPEAHWWDMAGTDRAENQDQALALAARRAAAELVGELGEAADEWRWGALHTATFENQTIGQSGVGLIENRFNRGPYQVGGSAETVNATGWNTAGGYGVDWLPSLRMIVDLGDLSRSQGIHVPGQSGHAYHVDYTSMVSRWLDGQQHDMPWRVERAQRGAEHSLRLRPG